MPLLGILFLAILGGVIGLKFALVALFGQSPPGEASLLFGAIAASLSAASLALFAAVYWRTSHARRWVLGVGGLVLIGSAMALWVARAPRAAETARLGEVAPGATAVASLAR